MTMLRALRAAVCSTSETTLQTGENSGLKSKPQRKKDWH